MSQSAREEWDQQKCGAARASHFVVDGAASVAGAGRILQVYLGSASGGSIGLLRELNPGPLAP